MANVNTQIADSVTTQTINLLRFSAGQQGKVVDMLKDLENELLTALNNTVGTSTFTRGRLNALLKQTRDSIATAYKEIDKTNQKGMEKVAALTADKTVDAVNTAVGAKVASVEWSADQLASIAENTVIKGSFASDWWDNQSERLQDNFEREMQMGLLRGESIDELTQRIRGTKENGYQDGIMNIPKSQAEALVRTSALSVSNDARMEAIKSNDQIIKGVQWVSTLDDRTTFECMALDGLEWSFPEGDGDADYVDYEPVGHDKEFEMPPIHWNCRSTVVPVTYSWEELAGAEDGDTEAAAAADAIPEETRASMDGQVAQATTFEDWLGGKPEGFQNEVLGEQRAEMWRKGEIELTGLTDQSNNPLTIEQLQAKAGKPVEEEKARTEPLLTGDIRTMRENPNEGTNKSFEVTFTDGNKGMFKPEFGESKAMVKYLLGPGEDPETVLSMARREVASSDIAKIIGVEDLVPNTVMREVDSQAGAMQQFVFGSKNALDEMDQLKAFEKGIDIEPNYGQHEPDIARAAAFDYLTGQIDRHPGNWMVNEETGKMSLIDNGLSFVENRAPSSDFIDKAAMEQIAIPPEVKEWQAKWPVIEDYMKEQGFTPEQIAGAQERLDRMVEHETFDAVREAEEAAKAMPYVEPAPAKADLMQPVERWEVNDNAGINTSFKVVLEDGTQGIFKPESGEDKIVQAAMKPGGRREGNSMAEREVAAYDIAKIVGMDDMVPQTVMRDIAVTSSDAADFYAKQVADKPGSLQEMVIDYKNAAEWGTAKERFAGFNQGDPVSNEDLQRIAAWDYFTGNPDRHDNNWMIHETTGKVALIDNGMVFSERQGVFSYPLNAATSLRLEIPPVVKEWAGKWPEIEAYMKSSGFTVIEIERAQMRLGMLERNDTFTKI